MNERDPASGEAEPSLGELVESVTRKLVTAIVIAGGLIALGLWSQSTPKPPHYQIVAADGRLYRLNTENGWVIGCEGDRCATIVRRGQELEERIGPLVPPRLAPPAQPAPAPAPAPTPAPAPAPTPANR
jgi:hypothetical protein